LPDGIFAYKNTNSDLYFVGVWDGKMRIHFIAFGIFTALEHILWPFGIFVLLCYHCYINLVSACFIKKNLATLAQTVPMHTFYSYEKFSLKWSPCFVRGTQCSRCRAEHRKQGGQIGRIFAQRVVVFLGQFVKKVT
jgi:hypothetical protein